MTRAVALICRLCLLFAVVSMAVILPAGMDNGAAAQASKKKTGQELDGRKTVIAGIKEYEAGKDSAAIATLSKAVSSGGLSSKDMAKALYFRGLANHRSGKSARAIADLTSAAWMKGGLSPDEQANALEARGKAYAAVGVKDPGPPGVSVGAPASEAPSTTAANLSPASAPPDQGANISPAPAVPAAASKGSATSGFKTEVARADDQGNVSSGAQTSSSSNPLAGVGSFFSNLFNGGGSTSADAANAEPAASAATTTASISQPATVAVSEWSSETSVSVAKSDVTPARTAVKGKTSTVATPSGNYKLQVAAVRSRDEAERLAGMLRQKHSGQIGSREPNISETVFGNMGTFYQVNVGPFAQASETDKVCKVLKADGFDCLVVKN